MANWTLITGASEGLGIEFAHIAAKEKRNVILAARSKDKLEKVADQVRAIGIEAIVIPADLSKMTEVDRLWKEATEGRDVDVLVNNAGLGSKASFEDDAAWEREMSSINVNMLALTRLMKLAVPHMKTLDKGRILNVASIAAFAPGPGMAIYCATKAYVLSLSEAVGNELSGTNVTVTALCPGTTATNFFEDANMTNAKLLKVAKPMDPTVVADAGWLHARVGKPVVVPGAMNKVVAALPRFVPRSLTTLLNGKIMNEN